MTFANVHTLFVQNPQLHASRRAMRRQQSGGGLLPWFFGLVHIFPPNAAAAGSVALDNLHDRRFCSLRQFARPHWRSKACSSWWQVFAFPGTKLGVGGSSNGHFVHLIILSPDLSIEKLDDAPPVSFFLSL